MTQLSVPRFGPDARLSTFARLAAITSMRALWARMPAALISSESIDLLEHAARDRLAEQRELLGQSAAAVLCRAVFRTIFAISISRSTLLPFGFRVPHRPPGPTGSRPASPSS
jgi:hypothetical protein